MLNQDALEKNTLVGKFVTLVFGEEYHALSAGIHSLDLDDLLWFRAELEKTKDESFQAYKTEWESLVNLLAKPENFDACIKQKKRLIGMKKILN